jgi:hypothetical protein
VYVPNQKVYMINLLPFLCFSLSLTVPASCDASASTGVFPSASFVPDTSPPRQSALALLNRLAV